MKYQLIALPTLAATVAAQDINSILNVLATALPSDLVAEAITNSAAVESQISSQFAAGETPTWFTALPSDVQGYLMPTDLAGASSLLEDASSLSLIATTLNSTGGLTSLPTITSGALVGTGASGAAFTGTAVTGGAGAYGNGTLIGGGGRGGNGTNTVLVTKTPGSSSTGSSSDAESTSDSGSGSGSGSDSSDADSSSSPTDSGAAPTGVIGLGLAGVVAVAGVFAL